MLNEMDTIIQLYYYENNFCKESEKYLTKHYY